MKRRAQRQLRLRALTGLLICAFVSGGPWSMAPLFGAPGPQTKAVISLSEAERVAEQCSFELRALRLEGAIGKETVRERFRAFFPAVSVTYRQNRTIAARDFDNGDYSVQLNVSQPIYDGGRTRLAYQTARIGAGLAGRRHSEAREALRLKVREAYLAVLQAEARISVARHSLGTAEHFFRMGRVEERQGSLTLLELRERASELEQRKLAYHRETDGLSDRLTDFAVLLQLPDGERLHPQPLDLFRLRLSSELPKPDALLGLAQNNHPKLRQFRMELAQKQKQFLITKYDYLPSVALTGRYGRTGETWPPRTSEWGVGVSVSFSLWGSTLSNDVVSNRTDGDVSRGVSAGGRLDIYDNPGFRRNRLSSAADLLRARRALVELQSTLRSDVRRVIRDIRRKREELRLADDALAVRELRHRIDVEKMRLGELRYRDFLEEEHRLIEARLTLAVQRTESVVSINRLEASLGLALDSLGIVNWAELRGPPPSGSDRIRRSWKPRTRIRLPVPERPGDKRPRRESEPGRGGAPNEQKQSPAAEGAT